MSSPEPTAAAGLWRDACARLGEIGSEILSDPIVSTDREQAEGIRHLLRQLMFTVRSEIEYADPAHPTLFRFDDDVVKWGGPNADNHYLRAAVDPDRTYRFSADVTGVNQLILSLHEGDMQLGRFGVYGERSLEQLQVDPDGTVTVTISPDEHPGNWILSDPAARLFLVRIYVSDWGRDRIPALVLEASDPDTGPAPVTLDTMVDGLDRALNWIRDSVPFWFSYLRGLDAGERNELSPPTAPPGGASDIAYGGGLWQLADDEAWLIEFDAPDADYWSVQTCTWPFFESGDLAHQTSLNHEQSHVDDDGVVRMIVSARDPGVANWIDTEGRADGLIVYRWIWARSRPVPAGRVIPVSDATAAVPGTHPRVGPAARLDRLVERRRAVQQRFSR